MWSSTIQLQMWSANMCYLDIYGQSFGKSDNTTLTNRLHYPILVSARRHLSLKVQKAISDPARHRS